MARLVHRPCPYRTRRKRANVTRDYCTAGGGPSSSWPACTHCRDRRGRDGHVPCPNRRKETRGGVTLDWCYAIGIERVGDMPCEYCTDPKENET